MVVSTTSYPDRDRKHSEKRHWDLRMPINHHVTAESERFMIKSRSTFPDETDHKLMMDPYVHTRYSGSLLPIVSCGKDSI